MLTETECLSKVGDFDQLALRSPTDALRVSYIEMAAGWRRVAAMAAWQSRFSEFSLERLR